MPDAIRFEFHIPKDLADAITTWRRRQPDLPDRSKAARTLIRKGLEAYEETPTAKPLADEANAPVRLKPWAGAPWKSATILSDRTVESNSRISEVTNAKLKWVIEKTGKTKKEIVEEAILDRVNREIKKAGISP
jgi:hypothetical protein